LILNFFQTNTELKMPAYHSELECHESFGNMAKMPLKNEGNIKGNAPVMQINHNDPEASRDIIDDVLKYFKPNVFFASFDFNNDVDRTFVYGILYVQDCLRKLNRCKNADEATKELFSLAVSSFDLPGDPGFPVNEFYKPAGRDHSMLKQYLTQYRQEIGQRLIPLVYENGKCTNGPSKWWKCFDKKKFMNRTLSRGFQ